MRYEDGLAVWDALRATGVMAFGVETYANTRRMEKSLRLQNADLLTEYNLLEADLARPKVKEADFRGKAKHLEYRAREHQPAMLCTLVMTEQHRFKGRRALSGRHHAGHGSRNRRDAGRRTRPPLLHHLGRLWPDHRQEHRARLPALGVCQEGRKLKVEYFGETYPVEVAGVGYKPLYDPENLKPRS